MREQSDSSCLTWSDILTRTDIYDSHSGRDHDGLYDQVHGRRSRCSMPRRRDRRAALGSVKTVYAFSLQKLLQDKYNPFLEKAKQVCDVSTPLH